MSTTQAIAWLTLQALSFWLGWSLREVKRQEEKGGEEVSKTERTCSACGATRTANWYGVSTGMLKCQACYQRARKGKLKRKKKLPKVYQWAGEV